MFLFFKCLPPLGLSSSSSSSILLPSFNFPPSCQSTSSSRWHYFTTPCLLLSLSSSSFISLLSLISSPTPLSSSWLHIATPSFFLSLTSPLHHPTYMIFLYSLICFFSCSYCLLSRLLITFFFNFLAKRIFLFSFILLIRKKKLKKKPRKNDDNHKQIAKNKAISFQEDL